MRLGDPLRHLVAEVGEVEPVAAAVEHALGVVDLTVPQQVDDGLDTHVSDLLAAAAAGAARREGVEDGGDGAVVVRRGDEPRLVRRRRAGRRPGRASSGRTRRRRPVSCWLAPAKSRDRAVAEEHREHGAGGLHDVRHAGGARAPRTTAARMVCAVASRCGVDLGRREPERGEAGGGGDRVPGERAGLVDRALGREVGHQVGATAEGRGREAAAHHLAEGHQVGRPALDGAVEAPAALRGGAEAGHHLVADEQRAVGAAGLGEEAR